MPFVVRMFREDGGSGLTRFIQTKQQPSLRNQLSLKIDHQTRSQRNSFLVIEMYFLMWFGIQNKL